MQHNSASQHVVVQPAYAQTCINSTRRNLHPGQRNINSSTIHMQNRSTSFAGQGAQMRYNLVLGCSLQRLQLPHGIFIYTHTPLILNMLSRNLAQCRDTVLCVCRHGQCQQSRLCFPPASLTLLDVVHEVPTLPELLTFDAQKALSAVSRSHREQFLARIQIVTVTCKKQFALVFRCRLPWLSMVILHNMSADSNSEPSDRELARVCIFPHTYAQPTSYDQHAQASAQS